LQSLLWLKESAFDPKRTFTFAACTPICPLNGSRKTFIIPNPWDAGSARLLEETGFKALATTSSGFANAIGKIDGRFVLKKS